MPDQPLSILGRTVIFEHGYEFIEGTVTAESEDRTMIKVVTGWWGKPRWIGRTKATLVAIGKPSIVHAYDSGST
jgi:hypothetical protein